MRLLCLINMMIKVLFIIFVLIISVTGQQGIADWGPYNYPAPNAEESNPNAGQQWPSILPGNYFNRDENRKKPCPNRRSQNQNVPENDEWIRTFHWKSVQPLSTNSEPIINKLLQDKDLQYQSLKGANPLIENKKDHANEKNSFNYLAADHQNEDPELKQNQPETDDARLENNYGDKIKIKPTTSTEHIEVSKKCRQKQELPEDIISSSYRRFISDTDVSNDSDKSKPLFINNEPTKDYDKVNKDLHNELKIDRQKPLANPNHKQQSLKENDSDDFLEAVSKNKVRNTNVVTLRTVDQKVNTETTVKTYKENSQKLGSTRNIKEKYPVGEHKFDTADIESWLIEPAKGEFGTNTITSRMAMMDSSRVCYACSSVSDITCWSPNRRTMVKYCRKGRDACVTRTYQSQEYDLIVIRDCSDSCDTSLPVLDTRYKSCSICKTDFCNNEYVNRSSGYSINSYNALFILFVALLIMYGIY